MTSTEVDIFSRGSSGSNGFGDAPFSWGSRDNFIPNEPIKSVRQQQNPRQEEKMLSRKKSNSSVFSNFDCPTPCSLMIGSSFEENSIFTSRGAVGLGCEGKGGLILPPSSSVSTAGLGVLPAGGKMIINSFPPKGEAPSIDSLPLLVSSSSSSSSKTPEEEEIQDNSAGDNNEIKNFDSPDYVLMPRERPNFILPSHFKTNKSVQDIMGDICRVFEGKAKSFKRLYHLCAYDVTVEDGCSFMIKLHKDRSTTSLSRPPLHIIEIQKSDISSEFAYQTAFDAIRSEICDPPEVIVVPGNLPTRSTTSTPVPTTTPAPNADRQVRRQAHKKPAQVASS